MAEEGSDTTTNGADSPEGVFGNLPSARPGSRSPRRRGPTEPAEAAAEKTPPDSAGKAPVEPEPDLPSEQDASDAPYEPEPPQPVDDPLAPQPSIQGVEDLAWAGVAVVAQAATAGIRFTSRALEAARKSIDRP